MCIFHNKLVRVFVALSLSKPDQLCWFYIIFSPKSVFVMELPYKPELKIYTERNMVCPREARDWLKSRTPANQIKSSIAVNATIINACCGCQVEPNSIAGRDGRIREGDRILQVKHLRSEKQETYRTWRRAGHMQCVHLEEHIKSIKKERVREIHLQRAERMKCLNSQMLILK